MTVIGMLGSCTHPEMMIQVYSYAAVAKLEGADFFYFSSDHVNLEERSIEGYCYEKGLWKVNRSSFPDVLFLAKPSIDQQWMIKELKQHSVILGSVSHDYFSLYQKIKAAAQFSHFLLPCFQIDSVEQLIDLILRYGCVQVISPLAATNINFTIKQEAHLFSITDGSDSETMTISSLKKKLYLILLDHAVLVQAYSKDSYGDEFTVRTQKSQKGQWTIISNTICKGNKFKDVTPVIFKSAANETYDLTRYLEHFSIRCSEHIESLDDHLLYHLEFNLVIDLNGRLWIRNVTLHPAEHLLPFDLELHSIRERIRYAMYIEHRQKLKLD